MNVKVQDVEKNIVELEIEVDADKFEDGMKKSFAKNVKRFNIPGFRKGKAPRHIVERYYGESVLYEDAINIICPEAYDEAIEQNDLHPVDRPEIDIKQVGEGQNLIFTAKVTVKPEVELGEYKGIEAEEVKAEVTDEDIEKEIKSVQERNARLITIEDRAVQDGDTVNIDFEGFIDGEVFEGGKAEGFDLVIGSGQFIPGFEEEVKGAETGAEIEVNVTFPEEYGQEELAGKPALFKVKVNSIKVKEYPELDDEFAKDVSEFDTIDEYKKDVKKNLEERAEKEAKFQTEENVIKKVVENSTIELPQIMVDKQIDSMVYDFGMRLRYQGMDLQKYLEIMGMDMETFRKQFAEKAEKQVRTQLVLEKISEVENIDVTEEETNEEVAKMAENYKQDVDDFKKSLREEDMDYLKNSLISGKTVDFLVEHAKLK